MQSPALAPNERLREVSLQIAGRVVRFVPADDEVAFSISGVRSSFVVDSDAEAACVVSCEYGDPEPANAPVVAEGGPLWELRNTRTGEDEITFYSPVGDTRMPWSQLVIDSGLGRARLIQRQHWGGHQSLRIGYPVDELLMCRLLMADGVLVVHGATVQYDDMALLFVGHSGAGKSTMAALAESAGGRVLSDDRSIVAVHEATATVWGTPWHGTHRSGSPASTALTAMFLLVQDAEDRAEGVSAARATGELLVRLIHPGARPADKERLLDTVTAVAERVPMAELRFRPTVPAFHLAADFARRNTLRHYDAD